MDAFPVWNLKDESIFVLRWLNGDHDTARLRLFRLGAGEVTWQRAVNEQTNRRFAEDNFGNRVYEDGEVYEA
jgi:hypothetical protein